MRGIRIVSHAAVSAAAVVLSLCPPAHATGNSTPTGAKALIEGTGIKGGLCLVLGAGDMNLAHELARESALYVQVLQPDGKLAASWGATLADSPLRESLGIRNVPYAPLHYGSDLLNLIVVEQARALPAADLGEVRRILAPRGCVAFRNPPSDAARAAKTLAMTPVAVEGFPLVLREPIEPVEWKPCDSLKWRAGMRAYMAVGIAGPTHSNGRFFYHELVEPDGNPMRSN
jgi:hypothetical protein